MAVIDYGALLRVNGNFINKNTDLFMGVSDKGYALEIAEDSKGGRYDLSGNVLAGDEGFFISFYRTGFTVVSNGKVILSDFGTDFISETYHFDGLPDLKISHLDKEKYPEMMEPILSWKDYVKEEWPGATGDEKLSELEDGAKVRKRYVKNLKRYARSKGILGWYRTQRWLAEWDYGGNRYEVIFGYGVDPNELTWQRIRNEAYDFTETEKEIIDSWFEEEKEKD